MPRAPARYYQGLARRASVRLVATPDSLGGVLPADGNQPGWAEDIFTLDAACFSHGDGGPNIPGAWWWLARTAQGTPVAYAALRPYFGDRASLSRVGVHPTYRGAGLQKRLLRIRERAARRYGFRRVITYTAAWNLASANSLIARGFRLYRPYGPAGSDHEFLYWYKDVA